MALVCVCVCVSLSVCVCVFVCVCVCVSLGSQVKRFREVMGIPVVGLRGYRTQGFRV